MKKPQKFQHQVEDLHDFVSRGVARLGGFDLAVRDSSYSAIHINDAGSHLIGISVELGAMRLPFEARIDHRTVDEGIETAASTIVSIVADAWRQSDDLADRLEDLREIADVLLHDARRAGGHAEVIG